MPRAKWFDKLIPAKGEAEVMARIKGAVGAKSAGYRRRPKDRFAKMRAVKSRTFVPLSARNYPNGGAMGEQGQMTTYQVAGSTLATNQPAWLFCIHPGADGGNTGDPFMLGNKYSEFQQGNSTLMRLVGMKGNINWVPLFGNPQGETLYQENCSGMFYGAWIKIKRTMQTTLLGAGDPRWPFGDWRQSSVAHFPPKFQAGYLPDPQLDNASVAALETVRDWRVEHETIMKFEFPWRVDYVMNSASPTSSSFGGAHTYKLPIPRKLVMNVGDDTALALVYRIFDNDVHGGGPDGQFNHANFCVQLADID